MLIFPFIHFHPFFGLISLFLYFLPAFLARNKSNFTTILLVNLLAGWTFIGWIIALVMAVSADPQQRQAAAPPATTTGAPQAPAGASFFCTSCGKPLAAGARFCSACGASQPSTAR